MLGQLAIGGAPYPIPQNEPEAVAAGMACGAAAVAAGSCKNTFLSVLIMCFILFIIYREIHCRFNLLGSYPIKLVINALWKL